LLENRIFSEHVTNTKFVDNGLYYLNMQFRLNPMLQTREKNPQKWHEIAYKTRGRLNGPAMDIRWLMKIMRDTKKMAES
jgi:hypothetical protein